MGHHPDNKNIGALPPSQVTAVQDALRDPTIAPLVVTNFAIQGSLKKIAIDLGTVYITKESEATSPTVIKNKIAVAINTYFQMLNPGELVRISRIYEAVHSCEEVAHFTLASPTQDISTLETEIAVIQSINIAIAVESEF